MYQRLTVSGTWPNSPQFTASGDTEVELINPNSYAQGKWITTADDTRPDLPETDGSPLRPGESRAVILRDGERLWLAAPGLGGFISFTLQH